MTPDERTARRALKALLRRLRKAESKFVDRRDVEQQAAWAAEAREIRATAEELDEHLANDRVYGHLYGECLSEAVSHVLLALVAVANDATFGAGREAFREHVLAAKKLLREKRSREKRVPEPSG